MLYSVIGIGLPRTGTTSLAAALEVLGYSGRHFCEINKTERAVGVADKKQYMVDNSLYFNLEEVVRKNIDAKFILTHRSEAKWANSMSQFLEGFPKKTSTYKQECMQLFEGYGIKEKLLILSITENSSDENWSKLCDFLDASVPSVQFPNINQNKD